MAKKNNAVKCSVCCEVIDKEKDESFEYKDGAHDRKPRRKMQDYEVPRTMKQLREWLVRVSEGSTITVKPESERNHEPESNKRTFEVTFFPKMRPKKK